MSALLVGYARVSTHDQDLTAQRDALAGLGVSAERTSRPKVACAESSPSSTRAKKRTSSRCTTPAWHSTAELSDLFGVGRSTVYRAIERDKRRRTLGAANRSQSAV